MEKLRQCRNNYRKGGCFAGKKHSEKEKTSLDSPSPKLNKSMIAYHETGDLNPVIAEFLGLSSNTDFTESELEQRIITHIQKFLMELGKGYAFVARQQHIRTEKEDYYIDLVFYNYILKCFVLIDLKTSEITHTYCSIIIQLKQQDG